MSRPVRPPAGFSFDVEIGGVILATPCYGGMVHCRFASALSATQAELSARGIPHAWIHTDAESLIQRARNRIAAEFLARPAATHLVFIDADIEWQPMDVIRLLSHGVDVVCGVYPIKAEKPAREYSLPELQTQIDWLEAHKKALLDGSAVPDPADTPLRPAEWPLHVRFNAKGVSRYNEKTGAVRINSAPTGFLCIRRNALEKMAESGVVSKIQAMTGVPDAVLPYLHDFFWCGVEDGIQWSEDYGFSRKWRQIGGEIWLDPAIRLIHMGGKAYDGDPCQLFTEPDEPILKYEDDAA